MKYLVSEVFKMIHNAKWKSEKLDILYKFKTDAIMKILIINFDKTIIPLVPLGIPNNYRKNESPAGVGHSYLDTKWRELHRFFKGGDNTITNAKRSQLYTIFLESLHQDDAQVVIWAVEKSLPSHYKGLSKAITSETWPQIVWDERL